MTKYTWRDRVPHCKEHDLKHWGPFCHECYPELFAPSSETVEVGGVKLIGNVTRERVDSVKKFIEERGIAPTVRLERVYCSPDAPATLATAADRRRGWRWEAVVGLPDEYRGDTKWAHGALRFAPGWDKQTRVTVGTEDLYVDSEGEVRYAGPDEDPYTRLDEGVDPPNLDPMGY